MIGSDSEHETRKKLKELWESLPNIIHSTFLPDSKVYRKQQTSDQQQFSATS